jgi:hypothetical protein
MLWLTVRQFRIQALVAAVGLVILGVFVVIVGQQVLHDWSTVSTCAKSADCAAATNAFESKYSHVDVWLGALVLVVPGLIGIFWGAPLVARELETGTFRLAWTQSVSRRRWTLTKLVLLGLSGIVVAGVCSLLVTWWASPLDRVGAGPFSRFDSRGIVPMAYAALAFTLGVATGAVMRRTIPAMVATLVGFAGIRTVLVEFVRPHLMAPLVSHTPLRFHGAGEIAIGPHASSPGAWVVSESIVDAAGKTVSGPNGQLGFLGANGTSVGASGVHIAGVGSCPNLTLTGQTHGSASGHLIQQCFNQLRLTDVTSYQPASRYWPFQIYESLLCLAIALLLAGISFWWVRRRIS